MVLSLSCYRSCSRSHSHSRSHLRYLHFSISSCSSARLGSAHGQKDTIKNPTLRFKFPVFSGSLDEAFLFLATFFVDSCNHILCANQSTKLSNDSLLTLAFIGSFSLGAFFCNRKKEEINVRMGSERQQQTRHNLHFGVYYCSHFRYCFRLNYLGITCHPRNHRICPFLRLWFFLFLGIGDG